VEMYRTPYLEQPTLGLMFFGQDPKVVNYFKQVAPCFYFELGPIII
jgi:hypothetical protein